MEQKANAWNVGAHARDDCRTPPRQALPGHTLSDVSYALEIEPQNIEVRFSYAHLLEENGRFEDAEKEYQKVTEAKPEYVEAYVHYGNMLRKTSRVSDAEAQYRKAISVNPRDFNAHFSYATLLEEQNRLEEAEEEYVNAVYSRSGHSR
ncbi:tetratricopeptide repeat protein [Methanocella arvoryzae]|uniref:Uncharacterized protein n=1 Tax=Methanocella arvoryzae (strain DSM 22066 / NBRC 105507 / MRE50) TaxID=351160 RepID=Q0W167_METAR|nr:tetratricopeptide repeat protein [Methanocella arvoryzae]CAJ37876.1 hypothetical protein RRC105 [Methanocella arvoryzae MRE50]